MMGDIRTAGTSALYPQLSGVFGGAMMSFASDDLARVRAAQYLVEVVRKKLTWLQVEADVRIYLMQFHLPHSEIDKQVARARTMFAPWLVEHSRSA